MTGAENTRPRIAVFASGAGQTFQALIDATAADALHAMVALLVTNRSDSGAAERARQHGVPIAHLSSTTHVDAASLDEAIDAVLIVANINFVVLAGYLKQLGPRVLAHFAGRIINTHPALLPRFGGAGMYGRNVHEAVLASGATLSGASIHYVTTAYDTGPVIAQREVTVLPSDTVMSLETRVKAAEQQLLIDALQTVLTQTAPELPRLSCPVGYVIQPASPRHIAAVPGIELAAASLFAAIDLPGEWASTATPLADLELACAQQRLFVALTRDDAPVGAALVGLVDGGPHLAEMDVHPTHARRGIGAALVRYVLERARCMHAKAMTLTTFSHIPWNAPFYARCGFVRIEENTSDTHLIGDELRAILAAERNGGLQNRIAMRAVL